MNPTEPGMTHCASRAVSGSFRDRDGRVYIADTRVFRGLSNRAMSEYTLVSQSKFYQAFLGRGELVSTKKIDSGKVPLSNEVKEYWSGFLEHERIPLISYPYEWTFSMLKDAALLQLKLTLAAVQEGFTLKDASPYNIQFVAGKPVFIDIASFETLGAGMPWAGYRQFCEMFLIPLLLQSYKGVDFQPFLRSRIDGIDLQEAVRLFSMRDRFRKGVLTHVWLQSKLDRKYASSNKNVRGELKSAGFGKELILVNLRKLIRLVEGLRWREANSEWGDYETFHNYSEEDHEAKAKFIDRHTQDANADTIWDIGCNTGRFSIIAAKHCRRLIACDIDHLALERLYLEPNRPENILPLLQNVSDPSPEWGWRNRERTALSQRNTPDMVMCLALVHHVVISANVPMSEFIEWLASITPRLIIEYVSRDDDKVRTLLLNREDKYGDYSKASLEQELARYFRVDQVIPLRNGKRRIYACSRRASGDE